MSEDDRLRETDGEVEINKRVGEDTPVVFFRFKERVRERERASTTERHIQLTFFTFFS